MADQNRDKNSKSNSTGDLGTESNPYAEPVQNDTDADRARETQPGNTGDDEMDEDLEDDDMEDEDLDDDSQLDTNSRGLN